MDESSYQGNERRRSPRAIGHFVVSYRILEGSKLSDLTQSKNISEGGLLITTNRKFEKGTGISIFIRLPFCREKIQMVGRVVDSKEIVRNLIYETRMCFVDLEDEKRKVIEETVKEYLKKEKK